MKEGNNPTLWAVENGTIYVFGGCQREYIYYSSIERYIKIQENIKNNTQKSEFEYYWEELRVYQPDFVSLQVAHVVDKKNILLFGGSKQDENDNHMPSKQVFKFLTETQEILKEDDLEEPLISIYPSFEFENEIILIDEKKDLNCPKIIKYPHKK